MLQLDSGLGSAERLLELCWKAAVAAVARAAESHGLGDDRRGLVEPCW